MKALHGIGTTPNHKHHCERFEVVMAVKMSTLVSRYRRCVDYTLFSYPEVAVMLQYYSLYWTILVYWTLPPGRNPIAVNNNNNNTDHSTLSELLTACYTKLKLSQYTPRRRLGERRYSSYSFSTSALDGGEWSASRPSRALPPGKGPPVPLYRRLGGPQSRSGHRR
jgi:hypothetical protein